MPEIIEADGNKANYITLDSLGIDMALRDKIVEEAGEFREKPSAEELADLYAVLKVASKPFGGMRYIKLLAEMKEIERGGFENGVFLVEVEGDNIP
ncbi:MAG: hypothetical protein ACRYFS_24555 [Janthinobacterium lividum]